MPGKGSTTQAKRPVTAPGSEDRIREVTRRLERRYGVAQWVPNEEPVETLVSCILSQHTSDTNSSEAYRRLRDRFPTWEQVIEAPAIEVADAIRCGGLANSKAGHIQMALRRVRSLEGAFTLERLRGMGDRAARDYLTDLPGVGPKTAAIVLCFALGRAVLPVDTHVFRVAWRLGWIDRRVGGDRAHDALQQLVPSDLVYRAHVALIRHGRAVCRAPVPRCGQCPLTDLCAFYQERARAGSPPGGE